MIAIINRSGDLSGVCEYEIMINKQHVTNFTHMRNHGLAVCLEKAAEAVRKNDRAQMIHRIQEGCYCDNC